MGLVPAPKPPPAPESIPPAPPAPPKPEQPFAKADEQKPVLYQDEFVTVWTDGTAEFRIQDAEQAKLAIKALRLVSKQLSVLLKDVNLQLREVRHEYTDYTRRRTSMVRGGGKLGQIIRMVQTISRDMQRNELAQNVEPLHRQKQNLDLLILSVNQHKLRIETVLLRLKISD